MAADTECHGDSDFLFPVFKFGVIHPVTEISQLLQGVLLLCIVEEKDKFLATPATDENRRIQPASHMLCKLL